MAKKSEKNENRRESLRKVKECPKKANEAPKQKAKVAKRAMDFSHADELALVKELVKNNNESIAKFEREQNERIINKFLDIGFVFKPEEGKLLDYFLRNKIMDKPMDFCPIKEVNVYESHPQALTGKSKVWYFFTRSSPNAFQPGTNIRGNWIFGKKEVIIYQDEKLGVKQEVEYCEADCKSEYKIIEYQLDPVPDYMKTNLWFVCKLYNDAHSGS